MGMNALSESVPARSELNLLIVEDAEIDAGLMVRELTQFGYSVTWHRLESAAALEEALQTQSWDVVLSDYAMPSFSGLEALSIVRTVDQDLPFILISGTIGEEIAVEAMLAGANDYLLKDRMARLGPAVERELREVNERRALKRAEEALRASEERLRLAWNTTRDFMVISRVKDGKYIDINQTFCDLSGYRREEIIGSSALDLFVWSDPNDRLDLVEGVMRHGHVRDWEIRLRRRDGEIRTALFSASLMYLDGEPHLLGAGKDIEDLKRAQQAVARSEELFRKYFELGLVGMALGSPEKRWVYVNDRICEMLGYSREELLNITWPAITHPDDLEADLAQFDRMLAGEIDGYVLDKRFIRKDGALVYTTLHVSCIRQEDGTVGHVITHLHDITERKNAERILKRHAQELETINRLGMVVSSNLSLDQVVPQGLRELRAGIQSDCAILFLAMDGHLVLQGSDWGPSKPAIAEFPMHRERDCLCDAALQAGTSVFSSNMEGDSWCKCGTCNAAGLKSVAAIPLFSGDEAIGVLALGSYSERDFSTEVTFIQSLAHAITMGLKNSLLFEEIQQRASELEERLVELRRANEEKDSLHHQLLQAQKMEAVGILSGGIAHDFNNLLQVIQGYSDLALFEVQEGQKGYRELKEIKKAAQRSAELTRGLLTFSRRIESKLRPMNVNREIRQVGKMLRRTIPRMIDIQISLEEEIRTISGDPSQLQQVLMNLALNARDAMPKGGTLAIGTQNMALDEEYCRKHLRTKPGDYVLISVSDNGSGMDKRTMDRIFDPFFTTKEVTKGTGLGLSIAYGIIKSHRGHILCYSELGQGTTFKIYLPAIAEKSADSSVTPETALPRGRAELVLIVDDEDRIRDVAQEILSSFGYETLTASNGKEAVEVYRKKGDQIDLVILDLIMPEMDGKQCLVDILQQNPSAKVLVASGYTTDGQLEQVKRLGATATISKPYETRQLLDLVRDTLDA